MQHEELVDSYLTEINHEFLTAEEEKTASPEVLVAHNLALVVWIASQYKGRGVELSDLIQEANLGLLMAATKFDGSLGFRFGTYAVPWLRQACRRAINAKAQPLRIPEHRQADKKRLRQARHEIEQSEFRTPDAFEVAERAGVEWHDVQSLTGRTWSLDEEPEDGPERDLPAPDQLVGGSPLSRVLRGRLERLEPRQRAILTRHYLDGITFKDIGTELGISRQRVQQVCADSLRAMRSG